MLNLPNRSLAMVRLEALAGRVTGANAAEDERAARRTALVRENFMLGCSCCVVCWYGEMQCDGWHRKRNGWPVVIFPALASSAEK